MNDPLDLSQPAEPLHDDADVSERAPEPPPKRGAGAKLQLPPPPVITAPPAVAADDAGIAQASGVLKAGGLVAFPTETVYGLGADASNAQAVARIFAVKGRPRNHPLIVHLASADDLATWAVDVSEDARQLARAFWPGPLTLILKRAESVLDAVTGEQDTVAVRVPSHPKALALLEAFGGGIAAPSANKFGRISPTTPDHVRLDLGQEVDLVLDGGACEIGIESTIVDCSGERPRLLRPGKITATEIEALLGEPLTGNAVTEVVAGVAPRVPGSHESHYAPRAALKLVARRRDFTDELVAHRGRRIAILALEISVPRIAPPLQRVLPASAALYARELYGKLRELDETGADLILVEAPPASAQWAGVTDRLQRAQHAHVRSAKTVKADAPWKKKAAVDAT